MLDPEHEPPHADPHRVHFWSLFEQSRIPMALVDSDRLYVEVNDAVVAMYDYPRAEILGNRAGWAAADGEEMGELQWAQLLRTNELYGERVITHGSGTPMHVSFAGHATTVFGDWLALFVTLSARFHPGGRELIGRQQVEARGNPGARLTEREREVVRLVALGSTTRQIAAGLSLSPDTVRAHVRNAMAKTGAHTRAQLVALVIANGLVED